MQNNAVASAVLAVALVTAGAMTVQASVRPGPNPPHASVQGSLFGFFGRFLGPACGNGTLNTGEQCDDGNVAGGDGCSAKCRKELTSCGPYALGEKIRSLEGCNACVCTARGMICTLRYCPLPVSCRSSQECPKNEYCTVEEGDCRSLCKPGQVCPAVCSGICAPLAARASSRSSSSSSAAACAPYRCKDGSVIESCTPDGHVINYFAAPCLTHGGEIE